MNKIRVKLIGQASSSGRGVGFYHDFLEQGLKESTNVEITNTEPNLVHYTFFDLFYDTLPFYKEKPTVVTIHDLTPLILSDLYPKGIRGTLKLIHQRLSLLNVRAVITDSLCSKKDIVRLFGIPTKKIFAIPLAVDPLYKKHVTQEQMDAVAKKYHLPSEFVLTVAGGPNPNKNLPLLAEATAELHIPLVIIGSGVVKPVPEGPLHAELKDLALLKKFSHLILPGFVPTEELSAIYRLATLYCQPALYEGFGLPLLEAMTCGCLIVSSNTSSLPEIYSDRSITFNPNSKHSLLKALEKSLNLTDHQKQHYIRASQHRSADFTWSKAAKMTEMVYQKVLG